MRIGALERYMPNIHCTTPCGRGCGVTAFFSIFIQHPEAGGDCVRNGVHEFLHHIVGFGHSSLCVVQVLFPLRIIYGFEVVWQSVEHIFDSLLQNVCDYGVKSSWLCSVVGMQSVK